MEITKEESRHQSVFQHQYEAHASRRLVTPPLTNLMEIPRIKALRGVESWKALGLSTSREKANED